MLAMLPVLGALAACTRRARTVLACTVLACCLLPLLAGAAQAAPAASAQPASAVGVSVTSLSPAYAQAGHMLTISGEVRNASGSAVHGLSVRLYSSPTAISSRLNLVGYAHGSYVPPGQSQLPVAPLTVRHLGAGQVWRWTAHVRVSDLGLTCFGVYPLTATVTNSTGNEVARDPVPLPYWPVKPASCATSSRPRPFAISWVWPLIDSPYQGACPGLLSNALQASIAPGGRLANLLAVGAQYAGKAKLTWAIDPALLDNVRTMTSPYDVGGSATCDRATTDPASSSARTWLAGLLKATAGRPVFVTPYADVDVAALIRSGEGLTHSLSQGDLVAHEVLGRSQVPVPAQTAGKHSLVAVAWPAGGVASSSVLEQLALQVSTVILTMPASEPAGYTPGAVTSVLTGIARRLHVLLADHGIAGLLASPAASSRQPGAIFGVSQLYLAETAQIIAESPSRPRPIVVTPPRRWDPTRRLAKALLANTVHAPWLSPSTAGQLLSLPDEHAYPSLARSQRGRELSAKLLDQVKALDRQVALLQSIRVAQDPALYRAVLGIESSAWRGSGEKQAQATLTRTTQYVQSQLSALSIGASRNVLLGGKDSKVTVLIHNPLSYAVRVNLNVHASTGTDVTLTQPQTIRIPASSYSTQIRLTVHATSTSPGKIRLTLTSPHGTPLPAAALVMHVRFTNFGTLALVIFAAALAVFVIASATRALRKGRPGAGQPAEGPEQPEPPAGDPGGHAQEGSAEPRDQAGYLDSVAADQPELTSAGRAVPDIEPTGTGARSTEEH
jgi:hypothetical protein